MAGKTAAVETEIHTTVLDGTCEAIEECLKSGQDCNSYNKNGVTALHLAVMRERNDVDDVIDILARHGADVNARDLVNEGTALHMAVRYSELAAAETTVLKLLEHGADPDIRDRKLRRPYDYALERDYVNLARLLSDEDSVELAIKELQENKGKYYGEKLIRAVLDGNQAVFEHALPRANVNYINEHGAAAIHYAVTHSPLNKENTLKRLVDSKADVNLTTYENDTALNLVIKTENLRENDLMYLLVGRLLEWGSDITQKDLDGKDATILAQEREYDDIVHLLKSHGTSPPVWTDPVTGDTEKGGKVVGDGGSVGNGESVGDGGSVGNGESVVGGQSGQGNDEKEVATSHNRDGELKDKPNVPQNVNNNALVDTGHKPIPGQTVSCTDLLLV